MYFVVRVRCRRKESSRSLSHLLMSFLLHLSDLRGSIVHQHVKFNTMDQCASGGVIDDSTNAHGPVFRGNNTAKSRRWGGHLRHVWDTSISRSQSPCAYSLHCRDSKSEHFKLTGIDHRDQILHYFTRCKVRGGWEHVWVEISRSA